MATKKIFDLCRCYRLKFLAETSVQRRWETSFSRLALCNMKGRNLFGFVIGLCSVAWQDRARPVSRSGVTRCNSFFIIAILPTVAEEAYGSTFRETSLTTQAWKFFTLNDSVISQIRTYCFHFSIDHFHASVTLINIPFLKERIHHQICHINNSKNAKFRWHWPKIGEDVNT